MIMSYRPILSASVLGLLGALPLSAGASPTLPGSGFVYDVAANGTSQCTGSVQSGDGLCDYTSPDGAAGGTGQTSGGIPGTPGYDGLAGTSVSAQSQNGQVPTTGQDPGMRIRTVAAMDYFFTVNGPGNQIPITVISNGLAQLTGEGYAKAVFTITDLGNDASPVSPLDFHPSNPLYDVSARVRNWNEDATQTFEQSWSRNDTLCVTPGDDYLVAIDVVAFSVGNTGDALATIDPKIKVDPPAPQNCELDGPLSAYSLTVSPGATTGFETVPEPSDATLAMLGIGLVALARRRRRTAPAG